MTKFIAESYSEFLNEKNQFKGNPLLSKILLEAEPVILDVIAKTRAWIEEKALKGEASSWSKFDEQQTRLVATLDLIKSIEKYTQSSDKLVEVDFRKNTKGSLSMSASVKRDGKTYQIQTQVIIAMGLVQRPHYRYLTSTSLPKTGNSTVQAVLKARLKKLSKGDKIQQDIIRLESRIKVLKDEYSEDRKMKNPDIRALLIKKKNENPDKFSGWLDYPEWDVIVSRGADKNYNYDESAYNKKRIESEKTSIQRWKDLRDGKKASAARLKLEVDKLKDKLKKLI